jgi:hypothetical protein
MYPLSQVATAIVSSERLSSTGVPRAGILKTVGGTFLFLRTFSKNSRFTFLRNNNVHQKRSVLILRS